MRRIIRLWTNLESVSDILFILKCCTFYILHWLPLHIITAVHIKYFCYN